jgi:hypothetical protein
MNYQASPFLLLCLSLTLAICGAQLFTVDIQSAFLTVHNSARAGYGVPPLSWNSSLAAIAQSTSDVCFLYCLGLSEN